MTSTDLKVALAAQRSLKTAGLTLLILQQSQVRLAALKIRLDARK